MFASNGNGEESTYTNSYDMSTTSASTTFSQRRSKKMAAVVEDGVYILKEVDTKSDSGSVSPQYKRGKDGIWRVDSLDDGASYNGKGMKAGYIV